MGGVVPPLREDQHWETNPKKEGGKRKRAGETVLDLINFGLVFQLGGNRVSDAL